MECMEGCQLLGRTGTQIIYVSTSTFCQCVFISLSFIVDIRHLLSLLHILLSLDMQPSGQLQLYYYHTIITSNVYPVPSLSGFQLALLHACYDTASTAVLVDVVLLYMLMPKSSGENMTP